LKTAFRQIKSTHTCLIACSLLLLILMLFGPLSSASAVSLRGMAEDGTRHFVCESACGRVRVKKIDKNRYRIFSIGYSGDLEATSAKQAARKACGELSMDGSKRSPPQPSRGGACR
jgi:hypothetical protein